MSDKFDKLICDFPEIYSIHGYARPDNPTPVDFGVGEGWFSLLYELSTDIMKHVRECPNSLPVITDIKEKYGGLRYYINGGDDVIDDLIHKAEETSYKTCESCGNPGQLVSSGNWLSTRCDACKLSSDKPYIEYVEELEKAREQIEEDDRRETD